MALVLDAGGLIAIDRQDQTVGALLRVAQQEGVTVRTSAAAVAQVWRFGRRQANLARVLSGLQTIPLDGASGRRIGELLARTGTVDIVDGHVGLLVEHGDVVVTSDPDDLRLILATRAIRASTHAV
jgi:hypothetical protein